MSRADVRLRVCYQKVGKLRFLSHLEVMRAIERATRRAKVPFAVTQGYSPHMRIAAGPALPVGTAGLAEYFDVWLTRYVQKDELMSALVSASVPELAPTGVGYVDLKAPSLSAAIVRADYEVAITAAAFDVTSVSRALQAVVVRGHIDLEQKGSVKRFDLTRHLAEDVALSSSDTGFVVTIAARLGPDGSLRPEAFLKAALSLDRHGWAIASLTRTGTFVESEDGFRRPL